MTIPKEQYLGIYFKNTDEDLIEWKRQTKKNYAVFVKEAIREKILRDKEEEQMEHPVVILRRMESQQMKIGIWVQKIMSVLSGNKHVNIPASLEDVDQYQTAPFSYHEENTLDHECVEAGWE